MKLIIETRSAALSLENHIPVPIFKNHPFLLNRPCFIFYIEMIKNIQAVLLDECKKKIYIYIWLKLNKVWEIKIWFAHVENTGDLWDSEQCSYWSTMARGVCLAWGSPDIMKSLQGRSSRYLPRWPSRYLPRCPLTLILHISFKTLRIIWK